MGWWVLRIWRRRRRCLLDLGSWERGGCSSWSSSIFIEVWHFHFWATSEEGRILDFGSCHFAVFAVLVCRVIHNFCRVILLALSCHCWLGCRVILSSLVCHSAVPADQIGSAVSLCCFGREGLATSIQIGADPKQSWIVEWGLGGIVIQLGPVPSKGVWAACERHWSHCEIEVYQLEREVQQVTTAINYQSWRFNTGQIVSPTLYFRTLVKALHSSWNGPNGQPTSVSRRVINRSR